MHRPATSNLPTEVRRIADLFGELSGSLRRIADVLASTPAESAPTLVPRHDSDEAEHATETPPAAWSWDDVVARAKALVADEPDSWTPAELLGALRRSGVHLENWRGVHVRLVRMLRDEGLIARHGGKYQRVAPAERASGATSKATAKAANVAPASNPKVIAMAPARDWHLIMALARKALESEPDRAWKSSELVRAIAAQAHVGHRRGLHFALAHRLVQEGIADAPRRGELTLRKPTPIASAVPPVIRRAKPTGDGSGTTS